MSGQKCVKVPVVLGLGSTQQLICTEIPLCPPAFEIKDVQKRVEVTSCEVGGIVDEKGQKIAKVIVDAVLKKNINFKTRLRDCPEDDHDHDHHHKKDDDDVLAPGETRVRCGDLRACFVEIPFCTLIEVKLNNPKVKVEDLLCQVEEAEVSAQVTEIPKDKKDKKDRDRDKDKDKDCDVRTFDRIVEKDVVRIVVKVERVEQLLVHADDCPPVDC